MLYDVIMDYLTGKRKKIDGSTYSREEVLRDLNRVFGPILLPGVTEEFLNKCCPEGKTLTDSELEKVLDQVGNLAKDMWAERCIKQIFTRISEHNEIDKE